MNKQDRKRFLMALTKTKVSLPGMNLSDEEEAIRVDVFWEELRKFSIEQIEEAFQWARGSLQFFPKPVELTDHIYEEGHQKYLSRCASKNEPERIEWMEPTDEGKKIAKQMIEELYQKWIEEDQKKEKDRKERFEINREKLKKQGKLLTKNQGTGE